MQYTVDQAQPGEEIRIASGTYSQVGSTNGITQVVYASKDLTLRGGYATGDWTTSDPAAHKTTLDAKQQEYWS